MINETRALVKEDLGELSDPFAQVRTQREGAIYEPTCGAFILDAQSPAW